MITLQIFLKKYSSISNTFINDFFSLYTTETTFNDLVINFDNLVNWLNMRKDSLKRTLIETYIKNIDYNDKNIIEQKKTKQQKELDILNY